MFMGNIIFVHFSYDVIMYAQNVMKNLKLNIFAQCYNNNITTISKHVFLKHLYDI